MKEPQLVISHNHEELTVEDAIITHTDVSDGFKYYIGDVSIKSVNFKKFVTDVEAKIGTLTEYDYSKNKNQIFKKLQNDSMRAYFTGNSTEMFGTIYTTSEEISNFVWKTFLKHCDLDDSVDIFMHSFYMSGHDLNSASKLIKAADLNYLSDKYYPYIDTEIMFDQFFTGAENIMLVVGSPGLGKSKLSTLAIKHAYNNTDKLPYDKVKDNPSLDSQFINVVSVKSTDVLITDKFWRELEQIQADIVIIDDLDYMLGKRDNDVMSGDDIKKNMFLNQFLSYTDGVEKHKTKFIITTNQTYSDIDSALLRKGRLFDILELRKLDKSEAITIWKDNGLDEESFDNTFKMHEILPADLGSEINKRLNTRIQTSTKNYLLEDGISKIEKASKTKRIVL